MMYRLCINVVVELTSYLLHLFVWQISDRDHQPNLTGKMCLLHFCKTYSYNSLQFPAETNTIMAAFILFHRTDDYGVFYYL